MPKEEQVRWLARQVAIERGGSLPESEPEAPVAADEQLDDDGWRRAQRFRVT